MQATNEFENNLFKPINNRVFSKTRENIRNQTDMRLVTNQNKYFKLVMKPYLKKNGTFRENLMAVEMEKARNKMMTSSILGKHCWIRKGW